MLFALQCWNSDLRSGEVIQLWCDNQVAVAYIKNMGGRVERLDRIARDIWAELEKNNVFMIPSYVNTKDNPADALTRGVVNKKHLLDCEVQLNPETFKWLSQQGPFSPSVDWFATSANNKLALFYSWRSDPAAEGIDAFDFDWGQEYGYIFPPFILIPRILRKIIEDRAEVILIHPDMARGAVGTRPAQMESALCESPGDSGSPSLPGSPGSAAPDEGSETCSFMGRWRVFDVAVWHTVLSSVASATKKGYKRIFLEFVRYFEEQGLDFTTISIDVVLSFLQRYVGLSESRIRSAVAALKFFLKIYKRVDLTTNPLLDMFSKGAQNLAPLPWEKAEIWNPTTVLDWIQSQPVPSDFLSCARGALILLLLSTGWRVDDVWKLSNRVSVTPEAAVFFFEEKRKCKIKGKFTVSQTVGWFSTNERLCPIRATLSFREKASVFRKDLRFLFVSSTGNRASKDTLRQWVIWTLSKAGISDSAGSCRSASTSAACARKRSIDEIMSSAGWSSETTFQRFYHRKILPAHAPLNLLDAE